MMKNELLGSAIPAKALYLRKKSILAWRPTYCLKMAHVWKCAVAYQAAKAAKIPKAPPARIRAMLGVVAPSVYVGFKYPTPKQRKAKSRVKKRKKNATVDLSVRIRSKKVKMNQP
jgi:hypothetical protein